jgi:hypothetical protein
VKVGQTLSDAVERQLWGQEFANQTLFLFVFNPGEQFRSQPGDGFRFIERETVVDFAPGKMTWLTPSLKDRFYFARKVRLPGGGVCRGSYGWVNKCRLRQAQTFR